MIKTLTGDIHPASSCCKAVITICDLYGNCCKTTSKGQGLDDLSKDDRERGNVDVFQGKHMLDTCSQVTRVSRMFLYCNFQPRLRQDKTLKVTLDITGGQCSTDGWFVDWIKIHLGKWSYHCNVYSWFDNGQDQAGPPRQSFNCERNVLLNQLGK